MTKKKFDKSSQWVFMCYSRHFAIIMIVLLLSSIVVGSPNFHAYAQESTFTPHFLSLRWDKANVRIGPGQQYPILWEFRRAHLPVEAIGKFESWIKIRYSDGEEGWIHSRLTSEKRWAMINGTSQVLRVQPSNMAKALLIAEVGVLGQIEICQNSWCKIRIRKMRGWVPTSFLWGIYPGEIIK